MIVKIKTYVLGSQSHEIITPITFSNKLSMFLTKCKLTIRNAQPTCEAEGFYTNNNHCWTA